MAGPAVRGMRDSGDITQLWADTFEETHLITVEGNEHRVTRFIETLPFDPGLLTIDRCAHRYDYESNGPGENHHVIVGNRHKHIVRHAKRRSLRNVFVFEDDAEFVADAAARLPRVLRWAGAHAEKWDIFYLGFLAPFLSTCSYVNRSIVRPRRPFHAHALCYNRAIYDAVLSIDFTADHRPLFFRTVERLATPHARQDRYFREGVGSLDSWLSFSGTRRVAASPILVVQTALPPGTEASWERRTGRPYDPHRTPRTLARIALAVYYLRAALLAATITALVAMFAGC